MKINMIHANCYDAKGNKYATGEQEVDKEVGEKLIKRGLATEVESKKKK